jgi:hypothetical protein
LKKSPKQAVDFKIFGSAAFSGSDPPFSAR